MRLKARPEDFCVREELVYPRVAGGAYFVHLLRKSKLTTAEALARVARAAGVDRRDIAFAGLKDRQGRTEQWITIRGRRFDYRDRAMEVVFQGRTDRPVTSRMSLGNRFDIVVRGLDAQSLRRLRASAAVVGAEGLPNYFDDQRFGCLRHGQGFAMRSVLRGDCEAALHQLIARPSPVAVGGDVKLKRLLARHWGRWEACARIARGPLYGRLFQHLAARPDDFAGALALLPTRLKLIHAFAYQSWLWNRAVDAVLRRLLPPRQVLLPTRAGQLLAWDGAAPELLRRLQDMAAPLFAPGGETGDPEGDPDFAAAMAELLAREGLERGDAAVAIAGMELRAEPRAVVLYPRGLVVGEPQADELAPGLRKVELSFGLPRGAYATLVVKRLLAKRATAGRGRKRLEGGGAPRRRGGQRGAPRI